MTTGVRWLWINNWYDGPLEGVVQVGEERLYAIVKDQKEDWTRVFELLRLSPEDWAKEDERHALFCECVGTHWCFGPDGKRLASTSARPREDHRRYYDKYPPEAHVRPAGVVVGEFED